MRNGNREERILGPGVLTEPGEHIVSSRQETRWAFLKREKDQTINYIKDLEQSLTLNKGIIAELLTPSKLEGQTKRIIEKLNQDNANLQLQLKRALSERDQCQGQLLIVEQMLRDFKQKEEELIQEYNEKVTELMDQLMRKEFVLQNCERRSNKAETLLKKFCHKDQEIQRAVKELAAITKEERHINNVVEENARLHELLQAEAQRNQALEQRVVELAAQLEELLQTPSRAEVSETAEHTSSHRNQSHEVAELRCRVDNLYKLNVKLSEALELANGKLKSLGTFRGREEKAGVKKATVLRQEREINPAPAEGRTELEARVHTVRGRTAGKERLRQERRNSRTIHFMKAAPAAESELPQGLGAYNSNVDSKFTPCDLPLEELSSIIERPAPPSPTPTTGSKPS